MEEEASKDETKGNEKPFSCNVCDQKFLHKSTLKTHQQIHTGNKLFICSECGKKFVRLCHFEDHERTHTKEKPFGCSFASCDKKFSSEAALKQHEELHTGNKRFSCSKCDFKCYQSSQLKRHERSRRHAGEKHFTCTHCEMNFARKENLQNHEKLHRNEKPFICPKCERRFRTKRNLKNHDRNIHTCELPYKCSQCDKKFTALKTMKLHEKSIHKIEKPFNCDHCEYKTADASNLRKHVKTHGESLKVQVASINATPTDLALLDKMMSKHGFFNMDGPNAVQLKKIWPQVEMSYNESVPESAHKTGKQLSKSYQRALAAIKNQHHLDSKKDREEIISLWKNKVSLTIERKNLDPNTSSPTDLVLLDRKMTRHGFFDLKSQNPDLLQTIWALVEKSYNENIPKSAHKTAKQLSKAYQAAVAAIKKRHGLNPKKARKEMVSLWKEKISLMTDPKADLQYSCTHCEYKCSDSRSIKSHNTIHEIKTEGCDQESSNGQQSEDSNLITCSKCDMKFKTFSALGEHQSVHTMIIESSIKRNHDVSILNCRNCYEDNCQIHFPDI